MLLSQLKPMSSQKPPGYVFVTSIAVIHLGFLKPELGRRPQPQREAIRVSERLASA